MIGLPAGTRVWIVAGHTDMRKGFDGLAALVQTALAENPFKGHVFVFRGRRGDIIKVLWFDGQGLQVQAAPVEQQVGIDACLLRDGRYRRTGRQAPLDQRLLEFVSVPAPHALGLGNSLVVHRVHLPG